MKKFLTLLIIAVIPALSFSAGIIKNVKAYSEYLRPNTLQVTVDIHNQVATTTIKETFMNEGSFPLFIKYGFPMDMNASATEFVWTMNGVTKKAVLTNQAPDTTATGPGGAQDYQLTNYLGDSPFYFAFSDSLPPNATISIEMTYIELLKYSSGEIYYNFPLDAGGLEQKTLDSFILNVTIHSQRTLESLQAVSHSGLATTLSAHLATAGFTAASLNPDKDFIFKYTVSQEDLGVFMLSAKPENDDGYFIMLAEPDPHTSQSEILSKNFVFVMDLSGSMTGEKMEQERQAAVYCLQHLNSGDKFNIITFRDVVDKYQTGLIEATPSAIQSAMAFANSREAIKGATTNINDAMLAALSQYSDSNAANIIVFLTDGRASAGIVDSDEILQNTKTANTKNTRVFVFGIGFDVERYLLTSLSDQNNGVTDYLENSQVTESITLFFNKIRDPLIQDISVVFSPDVVTETYPMNIPDIYVGEQLVLVGRYSTPGDALLTLAGRKYTEPLEYIYNINFTAADTNFFIPKMWAREKINALLILIDIAGENSNPGQEYIQEIIRLSLKYGIMTKYTSFNEPVTGIENEEGLESDEKALIIPNGFILNTNYPNPFNPSTTISYDLPESGFVTIKIYDITGRLVTILTSILQQSGAHSIQWDGTDSNGQLVAAGLYFCSVEFTNASGRVFIQNIKMSLVK